MRPKSSMWVANAREAVLSIITGGGKWVEIKLTADPLYQHSAYLDHEQAKAELKSLIPEDAKEAIRQGVRAKRGRA